MEGIDVMEGSFCLGFEYWEVGERAAPIRAPPSGRLDHRLIWKVFPLRKTIIIS
jgi:hypothetical protein